MIATVDFYIGFDFFWKRGIVIFIAHLFNGPEAEVNATLLPNEFAE